MDAAFCTLNKRRGIGVLVQIKIFDWMIVYLSKIRQPDLGPKRQADDYSRYPDGALLLSGPRGKSIFSATFRELTETRLGKEESAAADHML
jgi:hypothetical protein